MEHFDEIFLLRRSRSNPKITTTPQTNLKGKKEMDCEVCVDGCDWTMYQNLNTTWGVSWMKQSGVGSK